MRIQIDGLKVKTLVGIHPHERTVPQELTLRIEYDFGGRRAAESDDLEDTVDYDLLSQKVQAHIEATQYNLIERVAVDVGHMVMDDEMIDTCTVQVTKPAALKGANGVSVIETFSR